MKSNQVGILFSMCLAALGLFGAEARQGNGVSVVTVDAKAVVGKAAPDLWGIFLEDLDLALDGGLYAEMVRNRSFEDGTFEPWDLTLDFWNPVGDAEFYIDKSRPLGKRNRHACCVRGKPGAGIANEGYFGMSVKKGHKYNLSLMVRGKTSGAVEASLEAFSKPVLARAEFTGITDEWQNFSVTLVPNDDDKQARLVLRLKEGGEMYIDCVSMFPDDALCGIFRCDLVEKLAQLKPSFMRFPGGTFIKGDRIRNAYRWKETIGDVWERRTLRNFWRYWSSNGIGYHEYLLLAELLKAKPIYCINPGMAIHENVPMDKMGEFVQDALDCIEYANGPVDSKWGALRAKAGHPEPFNMEYLEIGNEQGGPAYAERYALIAKAVREKYPQVKLIFAKWGKSRKVDAPNDIRDDHFYGAPSYFMGAFAHEYDTPKGDFGIFVGEYAVTRGVPYCGSLRGAIAEAAFMLGLERNPAQVKLAAYAPLFAHVQHVVWTPNLIYHSGDGCFVNPSWNVQKLFSENRGAEVLKVSVETGREQKGIDDVQANAVRTEKGEIILKLVNCTEKPQRVTVKGFSGAVTRTVFTGPGRDACNTPSNREALQEQTDNFMLDGPVTLPPLSLVIYKGLAVARTANVEEVRAPGRTMLIHSHNDYAQKRPFWGAYEAGADSIEADVFLVDGDLLVAHSRKELKKENTLRRLYLEPLREVMRKNGGRARADGKPLQLLVDLKNGKPALDRLVEIVEKEGYRACFDIVKNPSATRLTVTGDHSKIQDFLAYPDFVFFDVPPIRQLADEQYRRVPLISHYARAYTNWRSGAMKEEDKEKIRVAVRQAHAKGAKFRLWGYPDHPEAWRLARELGLDYINTDRPAAAAAFLRNLETRPSGTGATP